MPAPAPVLRRLPESTPLQACHVCADPAVYRANTRTLLCSAHARRLVRVCKRLHHAFITVQCDELIIEDENDA